MTRSVPTRWRIAAALMALAGIATFASIAWATPGSSQSTSGIEVWRSASNASIDISGFQNTIVGSVTLPAGKYLFHAKASLTNNTKGDSFECRIQDFNGNLDDVEVATQAAFEHVGVALEGYAKYTAVSTTVYMRCDAGDANSRASWRRLDAIAVSKVN